MHSPRRTIIADDLLQRISESRHFRQIGGKAIALQRAGGHTQRLTNRHLGRDIVPIRLARRGNQRDQLRIRQYLAMDQFRPLVPGFGWAVLVFRRSGRCGLISAG